MSTGLDFNNFNQARCGLVYRWYHGMLNEIGQQEVLPSNGAVVTDMPERAAKSFPDLHIASTKIEFATEYIKLLGEWNQLDLFTEKQIRDFVDYIAVRKGGAFGPLQDVKKSDGSPSFISQGTNSTRLPWRVGDNTEARNLAIRYFDVSSAN